MPLAAAVPGSLEVKMVHDALEMLVDDETAGCVTEVDGLGVDVVGAEMN